MQLKEKVKESFDVLVELSDFIGQAFNKKTVLHTFKGFSEYGATDLLLAPLNSDKGYLISIFAPGTTQFFVYTDKEDVITSIRMV